MADQGGDMSGPSPGGRPTAERLMAVRTPMEIEFAPGGSRLAFTLHAVVSEHGVTQPSDLWLVDGNADPIRLTDGAWADTSPVWSPGRVAARLHLGSRAARPPPPLHDGA